MTAACTRFEPQHLLEVAAASDVQSGYDSAATVMHCCATALLLCSAGHLVAAAAAGALAAVPVCCPLLADLQVQQHVSIYRAFIPTM